MNEYLLSIMGIVLVSSVLTVIMPSGKMATVVKSGARLSVLLVVVAPLFGFLTSRDWETSDYFSNFYEESVIMTDKEFIDYSRYERIKEAEIAVEKDIQEKYSLTLSVKIEWAEEEEKIRILTITMFAFERLDEKEEVRLINYVRETYGCEGVIVYDETTG